ncbi:MAG: hypothetical protein ACJ8DJ_12490 [Gemmatimonadales bacterium]
MSVLPSALVAALADNYRIERELGRGGMATGKAVDAGDATRSAGSW